MVARPSSASSGVSASYSQSKSWWTRSTSSGSSSLSRSSSRTAGSRSSWEDHSGSAVRGLECHHNSYSHRSWSSCRCSLELQAPCVQCQSAVAAGRLDCRRDSCQRHSRSSCACSLELHTAKEQQIPEVQEYTAVGARRQEGRHDFCPHLSRSSSQDQSVDAAGRLEGRHDSYQLQPLLSCTGSLELQTAQVQQTPDAQDQTAVVVRQMSLRSISAPVTIFMLQFTVAPCSTRVAQP